MPCQFKISLAHKMAAVQTALNKYKMLANNLLFIGILISGHPGISSWAIMFSLIKFNYKHSTQQMPAIIAFL